MDPKNYGSLLYDAIRETLERMAFAEVIPCSISIGDQELTSLDDSEFDLGSEGGQSVSGWGDEEESGGTSAIQPPVQTDFSQEEQSDWGTPGAASPDSADDAWGTPAAAAPDDAWGTPGAGDSADDDWGATPTGSAGDDGDWGATVAPSAEGDDPWGEAGSSTGASSGFSMKGRDINFDSLVENQDDWIWSCMRVNSPDIHSVWFVVSKSLAMELASNMYAGEGHDLDSPLIRDIVAELTNVLGGKLMLLLEKLGGQFTLAVPDIGIGMPKLPDAATMETVLCKVLVDGEYPVMSSICFNKK